MVQTHSRIEGPQPSRPIPLKARDKNVPHPPQVDHAAAAAHNKNKYDSNYTADNTWDGDSQSELMKLKVENQSLMQLLKEEIKKRTTSNLKTTFEAYFARRVDP